jgi:hypothetical protein
VSYSTWFNRLNGRVGPLFQGRFKAVLHDQDGSALTINRYVHLNPVRVRGLGGHEARADLDQRQPSREVIKARVAALNYQWSSYNVYAGRAKNPGWVTTDSIYAFFGDRGLVSLRAAYRRQLEEMAALGDWETDWKADVSATVLLGSDAFVRQMIKLFRGNRHEQVGLRQSERLSLDWQMICAAVSTVWKGDWKELTRSRGNSALPAAWYLARNYAGMRLAELGAAGGGVAYPAVSTAIRRFEKRLKVDRDLQRRLKAVRAMLKI